jgi:hypothetical protein
VRWNLIASLERFDGCYVRPGAEPKFGLYGNSVLFLGTREISFKVRRRMGACKHQVAVSELRFGESSLVWDVRNENAPFSASS